MKKIKSNLKKGELTVKVESVEDLWHLSGIIDPGDLVSGRTIRKIKIGSNENRKAESIKKTIYINLTVEKATFSRSMNELRISGVVAIGNEDVPSGVHHTFSVNENDILTIQKSEWLKYQLEKIDDACNESYPKIVMVAFDREEAYFAVLGRDGCRQLSSIKGKVAKKDVEVKGDGKFYSEIVSQLKEYVKRFDSPKVIVASPSFWKDYFMDAIKDDDIKNKIVLSNCSSVGKSSFTEILKRDEIKTALKQDRISKEIDAVERLLSEIAKDNLGGYGIRQIRKASDAGAILELLVTDRFIMDSREKGTYPKLERIMKSVERAQGTVMIISSEHEGGKKLDGISGIGGILRYRI